MGSTRVKFHDESMNFLWSEAWKMLVSITQHKMAPTEQQSLKKIWDFVEKEVYKLIISFWEVSMILRKMKDEIS